jgi:Protein of unknown function (DUF1637).
MNPEMRRVVNDAEAASRGGWSDSDVAALAISTRPLRIGEEELQRLLSLPPADHGFREDVFTTDPAFHASVFGLMVGEIIPLHDHPSLDVITKVLRGRVRVQTYEWIDAVGLIASERGEVVVGEDDDALILRKRPGTLHTVTALEPAAFLDLFAPYYDDDARPCSYYKVAGNVGRTLQSDSSRKAVGLESPTYVPGSLATAVQLRVVTWEEARR